MRLGTILAFPSQPAAVALGGGPRILFAVKDTGQHGNASTEGDRDFPRLFVVSENHAGLIVTRGGHRRSLSWKAEGERARQKLTPDKVHKGLRFHPLRDRTSTKKPRTS